MDFDLTPSVHGLKAVATNAAANTDFYSITGRTSDVLRIVEMIAEGEVVIDPVERFEFVKQDHGKDNIVDRLTTIEYTDLNDVSPYPRNHQFKIGEITKKQVFERNGIKNMYDIQNILDAVEIALNGVGPGIGNIMDWIRPILESAAGSKLQDHVVQEAAMHVYKAIKDAGYKLVLK